MLLVLVKRLVLFSGSHGERFFASGSMLLILMLRRAAPRLYALYGAAQKRARKDGSRFASVLHTASGLFLTAKPLRAALKQPRGLASLRCTALPAAIIASCPREIRAAAGPAAANF